MALHFVTPEATSARPGTTIALTGAEAKHAAVVRRVRVGEPITLGDGAGVWLDAEVVAAAPSLVEVRVLARREDPLPTPRILLAQALAKGDRDELAVQAACELGVDGIVPWQATRSVSRWEGAKAAKGRERWASIVREAAKQAHRSWIPEVVAVESTADLVRRAGGQRVLILDPSASERLSRVVPDERDIVLVVGPEGGIAPEEIERLVAAGAERVLLGDTVLRTSTAGPAALAVLNVARGRW
ncbi:16S rRNA (uracil(1498)-N(3))-methyltransferase [Microbacterium sp.]|uniref:16S rRNA (uracil(1498)-N(3))-methyltransferase n=1 Tax=Microbacterium sp. TaxID=51671 RepID=UPI001AC89D49|nr:16S rRNA (uracil(1498)-N(3))-methyltransferase [Microbacterium sp.]MBN9159122.1 16S rRNA (uracil(1498)-N(3))-methyltransferase [Microbacterium sp.]